MNINLESIKKKIANEEDGDSLFLMGCYINERLFRLNNVHNLKSIITNALSWIPIIPKNGDKL